MSGSPVQRRRLGAPSAASRAVRGFRSRSGPASSAARVGRGATERFRAVSVPRTGATRTRATRYGRARMRHAWSTRTPRTRRVQRTTYVTPCASPAPRAWYRSVLESNDVRYDYVTVWSAVCPRPRPVGPAGAAAVTGLTGQVFRTGRDPPDRGRPSHGIKAGFNVRSGDA